MFMEEFALLWVVGGFLTIVALRGLLARFAQWSVKNDEYRRELHEILTKDEHKVKGRFE